MQSFDILIVGGGHGGAQGVIALRQRKFAGSIAIIGDACELSYQRTSLSKDYLLGEKGAVHASVHNRFDLERHVLDRQT